MDTTDEFGDCLVPVESGDFSGDFSGNGEIKLNFYLVRICNV